MLYVAHPEPWPIVYGEPSAGEPGDWWVTDLGTVIELGGFPGEELLERVGGRFSGALGSAFGGLLQWPVIYEQGGADYVRWLKVILAGELGGGVEQFQHSMSVGKPGADPDLSVEAQLALAEQLAALWAAKWAINNGGPAAATNVFSAAVRYTEVGVVQLEKTGDDVNQADQTQWWMWPTGTGPTGTGATLPFEVACAVTLQTDVRGPRGRGRMYLPPMSAGNIETTGLFADAAALSAGNLVQAFCQSVVDNTPWEPLVVSRTHQVLNRVTSVNCGVVPDSQRRRRRSQAEARIDAGPIAY